jgi:hypothetical protein
MIPKGDWIELRDHRSVRLVACEGRNSFLSPIVTAQRA